uniref:Uncharacterized protein n=1 Tax=Timema douglasi TaxID=61478 RepID=A0A7R8VMV5_TIMDO|nr:unnamed protein product [Timema douglasi]
MCWQQEEQVLGEAPSVSPRDVHVQPVQQRVSLPVREGQTALLLHPVYQHHAVSLLYSALLLNRTPCGVAYLYQYYQCSYLLPQEVKLTLSGWSTCQSQDLSHGQEHLGAESTSSTDHLSDTTIVRRAVLLTVCNARCRATNVLTKEEFHFFLTGGVSLENPLKNRASSWLGDKSWDELCRVTHLPAFYGTHQPTLATLSGLVFKITIQQSQCTKTH